jgi:hypothetical protein
MFGRARLRPSRQWHSARTEARPPGITQGHLGWGVSGPRRRQLSMFRSDRPPPQPSPTRGEGEGKRNGPITPGQFNGIGFGRTLTGIPDMTREGSTINRRAAGRPSAVAPRALASGLRRWVSNLSTRGRRSAVPAPYRLSERFGRSGPPMSPPQRQSTDGRGHTSQDQRRRLRHVPDAEIVGLESGPGRAVI